MEAITEKSEFVNIVVNILDSLLLNCPDLYFQGQRSI